MSSRLRENTNRLFEAFFEIGQPLKPSDDPKRSAGDSKEEYEAPIIQQYPPEIEDKNLARTAGQMSFPCEVECTNVELFTFTITDVNSIFRFGFCRHSPGSQTCLVVISYLPWFEVFYKLLNQLAEIINRRPDSSVMPLLEAMYNHEVPTAATPATIVAGQEMFSFNVPDPNVLPSIPASRNLTEYYNAIDPQNMIVIFASLLHERRVIFHSKKLSRLTACTYAAEALLYPMHWQHVLIPLIPGHLLEYLGAPMPFIIGVHTSLYKRFLERQRDSDRDLDVVVVDADNNKVHTAHYDVERLPEDVASYLKKQLRPDKLKTCMAEQPDAISQAFMNALVRLIGGYRDALKFQPNDKIIFDEETFLGARSSMKPFLESMLTLQIFREFLDERVRQLNAGEGFNDIFEKKSMLYSDKLNSDHRYKEWLQNMKKQGKKFQKGSRDVISGIRDKAAPVMSNAMQSVKSGGKKAYSGIKNKFNELNESSKSSPGSSSGMQDPGRTKTYKSNGAAKPVDRHQRPTTIVGSELKSSRPPRPPPPDYAVARKSAMPSSKPKLLMVSEDDTALDRSRPTSQHLLPVLTSDLHRSASAENFAQIPKRELLESEDDSSCSTPPPAGGFTPGDLDSDIPYVDFDAESIGSNASHSQPEVVSDLADLGGTEPEARRPVLTQPAKLPVPPPRVRNVRSVPPIPPRSGDLPVTSAPPTVPPRGNLIKLESSESEPDLDPFDPLAGSKQLKPQNKDSGIGDLSFLQDSSANASSSYGSAAGHTIMNLSFALADQPKTSDSADGAATSPGFRRSEGGRSSLIKRTNAFRNPSQDAPVRTSSIRDKDASAENSLDSLFDPLAAPAMTSWQQTAGVTRAGKSATDKDSPPSLIQDWTLQHLTAPAPQLGPVRQGPPPAPPKPHSIHGPPAHANPLYFDSQPPMPKPRTSQTNPLFAPPRQPAYTANPLYVRPPSKSPSGSSLGGRGGKADPFAELAPPELSKGPPKRPPPPSSNKPWETFE